MAGPGPGGRPGAAHQPVRAGLPAIQRQQKPRFLDELQHQKLAERPVPKQRLHPGGTGTNPGHCDPLPPASGRNEVRRRRRSAVCLGSAPDLQVFPLRGIPKVLAHRLRGGPGRTRQKRFLRRRPKLLLVVGAIPGRQQLERALHHPGRLPLPPGSISRRSL